MLNTKLIEHPYFTPELIPDGWERLTEGSAMQGDQILIGSDSDSLSFMPWVPNDGSDISNMKGGTIRDDGEAKPYKKVLIRKILSPQKSFLRIINNQLPSFIVIEDDNLGVNSEGTTIFKLQIESSGLLERNTFKATAKLKDIINSVAIEVFGSKPDYFKSDALFSVTFASKE